MKILKLLLCLLTLTACNVRGRVLIVGDSNAAYSADVYVTYLYGGIGAPNGAPGYLLTFAAVPGAAFAHMPAWVYSLASVNDAGEWDAVVLNLGVNDAGAAGCTTGLADTIDAVYGALPARVPIIVLDAPAVQNSLYSPACVAGVNRALRAAHERWKPRTRYVSVDTVLRGLPVAQRFQPDGVHYSSEAKFLLAEAIRVELDAVLHRR